ncbi:MAG: SpoIID/LytB domain-containing protein [Prevotella sp.]|jgi:SpoIID/LytB domain protein|nr:SpoIID/LytB domain-containing protein [Prevotella sp.]
MEEPVIKIGIMSRDKQAFILDGKYTVNGQAVSGGQTLTFDAGKIRWNGGLCNELLFVPDAPESTFVLKDVTIGINFHWERNEDQRFQGALKFIVEAQAVTAVNIIAVESYLTSVIASEMSSAASLELLKAHAVISRSWLLAQIEKSKTVEEKQRNAGFVETAERRIRWYDREDHHNFDVCADDHCQRYQGVSRAFENIEQVKKALASTRGEVLCSEGKICDARFGKCCGGMVEEFESCWEDTHIPYLVKVRDDADTASSPDLTDDAEAEKWIREHPSAFCNTTDKKALAQVLNNYDYETADFYRWTVSYSAEELSELVKRRSGIDFGTILDLIPVKRGVSARIVELKIAGTKKTMIVGKELEIRRFLSESHLYSSAFYVEKQDGRFVLHGAGWGHGAGLCQIGAAVMGEKGYTYDKILLHYYKGVELKKWYE